MRVRLEDWGFSVDRDGSLLIGGVRAEDLARAHATPLHVLDEDGLRSRARRLRAAFAGAYPGEVRVHHAWKSNSTPGIVKITVEAGLLPEVGTLYEWRLARTLGIPASRIIVNGPWKGELLSEAVRAGEALIVLDSLEEIERIEGEASAAGRRVTVLLRVNPNCVPRGMNRASATGSRRQSLFGLDLVNGELDRAFARLRRAEHLEFAGLHCHVGTGIRAVSDYRRPLERLIACAARARDAGLAPSILDIGGGFGVSTSRELSTSEFLLYQGAGRLPRSARSDRFPPIEAFAEEACRMIVAACGRRRLPLPRLVVEPGRCLVSASDCLLVTVGAVKTRKGVATWAITDGGAGTVAFPLFYELHEVLLARDPRAHRSRRYHVVGSACHSADWIYKNLRMPPLFPGDVLAICDAGAYFTVQESNFGFPRPAIVAVRGGETRLLRRRESFEDMVARDLDWRTSDARA